MITILPYTDHVEQLAQMHPLFSQLLHHAARTYVINSIRCEQTIPINSRLGKKLCLEKITNRNALDPTNHLTRADQPTWAGQKIIFLHSQYFEFDYIKAFPITYLSSPAKLLSTFPNYPSLTNFSIIKALVWYRKSEIQSTNKNPLELEVKRTKVIISSQNWHLSLLVNI